MPGTGRREAGDVWESPVGGWWAACSVRQVTGVMRRMLAEIMTSVDIIV
jgi:hypothetical protein